MHHPRWNPEPSSSHRQVGPRPQVGVVEHAADYEVFAELPSSRPEDVTVHMERGSLIIRARRADLPVVEGRAAGWQVSLAFGDLVQGDARIVMQDSLLLVTLPKAPGSARARGTSPDEVEPGVDDGSPGETASGDGDVPDGPVRGQGPLLD